MSLASASSILPQNNAAASQTRRLVDVSAYPLAQRVYPRAAPVEPQFLAPHKKPFRLASVEFIVLLLEFATIQMAEGTASTHLGMSSLNPDRDAVPKNVSRDSLLGQESASGPDSTKQERREAPETLRRSAFHEWLSTIFDIFFAAIPLFFLGTYT